MIGIYGGGFGDTLIMYSVFNHLGRSPPPDDALCDNKIKQVVVVRQEGMRPETQRVQSVIPRAAEINIEGRALRARRILANQTDL